MREETQKQIAWFAFELLKIRTDPNLVDGKYGQPIIFNLRTIKDCADPYFKMTEFKTPKTYAEHFLEEVRGYYADKNRITPVNSGLTFNVKGNQVTINGYTTAILKRYLKDEHNCLSSMFNTYKKNNKFYISFIGKETDVEIAGDILTAFRVLHKKCYNETEYIKWDSIFKSLNDRREILEEHNLNSTVGTNRHKMDYVYQTVMVKLARLLKTAIGDPDFDKRKIIVSKYGGFYRLAL